MTDHVGSVPAIINRNKRASGAVDVIYASYYYPFSSELQSAGISSGYQGEFAEKDTETGWNNFYLRHYDPAIGRWLSTVPYGQYHSPYVGMGNNPVNAFDADGGWSSEGGGEPPLKMIHLDAAVVTVKQWSNNSVSYLRNVNWAQQWNDFQEGIPVWGYSRAFGSSMNSGNYLAAGGHFPSAIAEGITLGYASVGNIGTKGAVHYARKTTEVASKTGANIGTKLEYVFGKATGAAHNIERSTGMLRQIQSVGIFDNAAGRSLLNSHLQGAYNSSKGILQSNDRYLRESLLMGPNGGLKVESIWEGNRLITVKLLGGK